MAVTPYITRADIEAIVGATRVIQWADLENNRDDDEITARVNYCIQLACEQIVSKLRLLTYDVTEVSAHAIIVHLTAIQAADLLYGPRKPADADADKDMMRAYRKELSDTIKEIASGRMDLGLSRLCRPYPAVVRDDNPANKVVHEDGTIAVWRDE